MSKIYTPVGHGESKASSEEDGSLSIDVPGQISVFGWDDDEIGRCTRPALSTVSVDRERQGRPAAGIHRPRPGEVSGASSWALVTSPFVPPGPTQIAGQLCRHLLRFGQAAPGGHPTDRRGTTVEVEPGEHPA